MLKFEDLDLFQFDQLLSDEERMVRDSVQAWVRDRVLPDIEQWAWEGVFPRHLVKEMGDLHLLGASFSEYDLTILSSTRDSPSSSLF